MKSATAIYLGVTAVAMVGVLGVPLLVFPRAWARLTGWKAAQSELEDYFARSLGAIGMALGAACGFAALGQDPPRALLLALAAIGAGATAVHAVGALRGRYPRTEALEVPVLAGWTAWGTWVLVGEL